MKQEQFWKLARPDGFDFYTGKTINYREHIGKTVKCPDYDKDGELCSGAFLHASRTPEQCFVGAKIPCSVYRVSGVPIKEDEGVKAGFKSLRVIKEMNPEDVFKWRYAEAANPVHPFKIKPPEITDEHIRLLKEWDSVRETVWAPVWDSVRETVRASVGETVWASVRASVGETVEASVGASVWASVRDSVRDSVRASVGETVWASVWASVWDSVRAYTGYIFAPVVDEWKYIDHKKGEYPFQPAVDLWKQGLVPSFNGKIWRLHGGKNAEVLWEGQA
jgi:hypothetical protein